MADIFGWLNAHLTLLLAAALGISELLALIPSIQSNSIFQLIFNALKKKASEAPKA